MATAPSDLTIACPACGEHLTLTMAIHPHPRVTDDGKATFTLNLDPTAVTEHNCHG